MTLEEIKTAVRSGKKVCWCNTAYEVKEWAMGFVVVYIYNNNAIGLTWEDGVTLNGKEHEFFIHE